MNCKRLHCPILHCLNVLVITITYCALFRLLGSEPFLCCFRALAAFFCRALKTSRPRTLSFSPKMCNSSSRLIRLLASSRFCCLLRVSWHLTISPVGECFSCTQVDNLLIACPPGPDPRIKDSSRWSESISKGSFLDPVGLRWYLP